MQSLQGRRGPVLMCRVGETGSHAESAREERALLMCRVGETGSHAEPAGEEKASPDVQGRDTQSRWL